MKRKREHPFEFPREIWKAIYTFKLGQERNDKSNHWNIYEDVLVELVMATEIIEKQLSLNFVGDFVVARRANLNTSMHTSYQELVSNYFWYLHTRGYLKRDMPYHSKLWFQQRLCTCNSFKHTMY